MDAAGTVLSGVGRVASTWYSLNKDKDKGGPGAGGGTTDPFEFTVTLPKG